MKAILVNAYGGPDVLQAGNASNPVAGAGEVIVRVAATSINPIDVMRRTGLTQADSPLEFPAILGYDLAGTIVFTWRRRRYAVRWG
jgi:NADPH:quinone reductase-like Zn-dependent oxidoreductase